VLALERKTMPPKPATAPKTGAAAARVSKSPAGARPPAGAKPAAATPKAAKAGDAKPAKEDKKADSGGGMTTEEQERLIRNSIDHESKIRDQIAALTGKVRLRAHFFSRAKAWGFNICAPRQTPRHPRGRRRPTFSLHART
jgi:hypothetical protein